MSLIKFEDNYKKALEVLATTKISKSKAKVIEELLNEMKNAFTEVYEDKANKTSDPKNKKQPSGDNIEKKMRATEVSEDGNESSGQRKDSFVRFGYDLIELIFGHLSIEDKFRFECLFKHNRSLVFNKQNKLTITAFGCDDDEEEETPRKAGEWVPINDRYKKFTILKATDAKHRIKPKIFENILKKLKFLTRIEFNEKVVVDSEIIKMIGDYCPHLKHLAIDTTQEAKVTKQAIRHFGDKCGQNLLSVKSSLSPELTRDLLSLAPNVNKVGVKAISALVTEEGVKKGKAKLFLKSLTEFESSVKSNEKTEVSQFQEQYHNSIVRLALEGNDLRLNGFVAFNRLSVLKLKLYSIVDVNAVEKDLDLLADKCQQLTELSVESGQLFGRSDEDFLNLNAWFVKRRNNAFNCFGKFKNLVSLELNFMSWFMMSKGNDPPEEYSVEELKNMSQLKRLSLRMESLCDQNLDKIDKWLPKLESINFDTRQHITNSSLTAISRLKALKSLSIRCNNSRINANITDVGVKRLLANCRHLTHLELTRMASFREKKLSITRVTADAFIAKARQQPKVNFTLGINRDNCKTMKITEEYYKSDQWPRNLQIVLSD